MPIPDETPLHSRPSPQRIVSLLPSATEMLFAMGVGERVVGVSHECDYPAPARQLPQVSRSLLGSADTSEEIDREVQSRMALGQPLYGLDEQLLARLKPDLVITQSICDVCSIRFEDVQQVLAASPVLREAQLVGLYPESLTDILNDIERLGTLCGVPDAARRVRVELERRVAAVRQRSAERAVRPQVVCVEWIEPFMPAGNWIPELVALAGGDYPLAEAGKPSAYADWESVRACDPDRLILCPCGFDLRKTIKESQVMTRWEGWKSLRAVRENAVFAMDGNALLNRSGPRIVDSLERLAQIMEPADSSRTADPVLLADGPAMDDDFCRLISSDHGLLPATA